MGSFLIIVEKLYIRKEDQCRGPATVRGPPLTWVDGHLQQQQLAGGVSQPKESVEAAGDNHEGVGEYGSNGVGPWDYV